MKYQRKILYKPGSVAIRLKPNDVSPVLRLKPNSLCKLPITVRNKRKDATECLKCSVQLDRTNRACHLSIFCESCVDQMKKDNKKVCRTCEKYKDVAEFGHSKSGIMCRTSECYICKNQKRRKTTTKCLIYAPGRKCLKCKIEVMKSTNRFCAECIKLMKKESKKVCQKCFKYQDLTDFKLAKYHLLHRSNECNTCRGFVTEPPVDCLKCKSPFDKSRHNQVFCNNCKLIMLTECKKVCTGCQDYKPAKEFDKNRGCFMGLCAHCKDCDQSYRRTNRDTIDGRLKALWVSAKASAKKRATIDHKIHSSGGSLQTRGEFDLSQDDIKILLNAQDGRCYYSGVKFSFK